MKPKQYKARDLKGNIVHGWYVEQHLPHFDNDLPYKVVGYDIVPSIFNDEDSNDTYWHSIDITTLEEVNEQLTLF